MFKTANAIIVAALVVLASLAGVAQAADDHLLDFEGISDADRAAAEAAHEALENANRQMCEVMVRIYAGHVARVDNSELAAESANYIVRRCVAEAFSSHIEHSTAIHDLIHRHAHNHESE